MNWFKCLTKEDAEKRVLDMRVGVLDEPSEEYLIALRECLQKFMVKLDEKIVEMSQPYEVWDSEYHGKDCDTQEVVYSGTKEQCRRFVDSAPHNYRFTMQKAGCD